MDRLVDVDYLVVGAGASGMAFVDALLDRPDVRVAMVDRRHGVGGHWLAAYPFVRLHQASAFYGVASTLLGGDRVQTVGPEAGLYDRAGQAAICAYYADVAADRMVGSGQVELFTGVEYVGGPRFVSRVSGQRYVVPEHCRIVDARYLAPDVPAETPPRFAVDTSARVVAVNDLVDLAEAPSQYVVVGSGKTATDAVVWLLGHDVAPDAICWVRPRDPWMLDRARVQPDPAVFLGLAADIVECAAGATSLDGLFGALEDAGVMLRLDPDVTPTMAKAPTLGRWELELLRTVRDVVRLGRITRVARGRLDLARGSVRIADDAVIVNCAADGLKRPPSVSIWAPEAITLQPVRAGFPCFGAALIGRVEATRPPGPEGDEVKNGLCRPSSYGDSATQWAQMTAVGAANVAAFSAAPDLADWANRTTLNPAAVHPDQVRTPALEAALHRLAASGAAGSAQLTALASMS